jgi:type VI protein secretion system component Hcp
MATDAYIKFGESSDKSPYGTPLPDIEGDSTDIGHYWWCELRGYDFSLDAGERDSDSAGDDKDKEKPKPSFKKVTIKKRVDWASTQLFLKCCSAAEATARKLTGDQDRGRIDRVTIDICKESAIPSSIGDQVDDTFPFITVRYFGVRIVGYAIDMSKPEPDETISFVFEKLEVEYQPTNPLDGTKIAGKVARAMDMKNYAAVNQAAASSGATSGASTASTTASASTGGAAAAPTSSNGNGGGAPGGDGSSNGAASPTEAAVNANFPGLWTGNGFGVLPD